MLNRRNYFIREHLGVFKLKDTYDILDPDTNEQIGLASEATPSWAVWLRLLVKKNLLPLTVVVREHAEAAPVLRIERGWTFWRAKVRVLDAHDNELGYFRSKLLSLNGGFHVYNPQDEQVAEIKGSWKSWDFKFIDAAGQELGVVTKQWGGLGKELFTTADNYLISVHDAAGGSQATKALLLAAGLAIDTVFHERQ
jgi:uncharacterized protein YxjI